MLGSSASFLGQIVPAGPDCSANDPCHMVVTNWWVFDQLLPLIAVVAVMVVIFMGVMVGSILGSAGRR